jgi:hypothetical protein
MMEPTMVQPAPTQQYVPESSGEQVQPDAVEGDVPNDQGARYRYRTPMTNPIVDPNAFIFRGTGYNGRTK